MLVKVSSWLDMMGFNILNLHAVLLDFVMGTLVYISMLMVWLQLVYSARIMVFNTVPGLQDFVAHSFLNSGSGVNNDKQNKLVMLSESNFQVFLAWPACEMVQTKLQQDVDVHGDGAQLCGVLRVQPCDDQVYQVVDAQVAQINEILQGETNEQDDQGIQVEHEAEDAIPCHVATRRCRTQTLTCWWSVSVEIVLVPQCVFCASEFFPPSSSSRRL